MKTSASGTSAGDALPSLHEVTLPGRRGCRTTPATGARISVNDRSRSALANAALKLFEAALWASFFCACSTPTGVAAALSTAAFALSTEVAGLVAVGDRLLQRLLARELLCSASACWRSNSSSIRAAPRLRRGELRLGLLDCGALGYRPGGRTAGSWPPGSRPCRGRTSPRTCCQGDSRRRRCGRSHRRRGPSAFSSTRVLRDVAGHLDAEGGGIRRAHRRHRWRPGTGRWSRNPTQPTCRHRCQGNGADQDHALAVSLAGGGCILGGRARVPASGPLLSGAEAGARGRRDPLGLDVAPRRRSGETTAGGW